MCVALNAFSKVSLYNIILLPGLIPLVISLRTTLYALKDVCAMNLLTLTSGDQLFDVAIVSKRSNHSLIGIASPIRP